MITRRSNKERNTAISLDPGSTCLALTLVPFPIPYFSTFPLFSYPLSLPYVCPIHSWSNLTLGSNFEKIAVSC